MSDEESSSESELDFETRPDLMRSADVGWIQGYFFKNFFS